MKILAIDIETSFTTAGVWGLFNQNVAINQILEPGQMICYAAKWVGQPKMFFARRDDKNCLEDLWKLLNEAQAVLSYNGTRFDMKKINREMLLAGLPPPAPYKHIDLLKTVKKQFSFVSNKLDWISQELGIGEKVKHEGFPLWKKCMAGDEAAWKRMKRYNIGDVKLLERLYYKLQGWITNHPSFSLDQEERVCTNCAGHSLQHRGYQTTKVAKYARLACSDCGAWQRERINEVHPDNRPNIVIAL